MVIQRILRHANVSTTATYYIKTAANDVRDAMAIHYRKFPPVAVSGSLWREIGWSGCPFSGRALRIGAILFAKQ